MRLFATSIGSAPLRKSRVFDSASVQMRTCMLALMISSSLFVSTGVSIASAQEVRDPLRGFNQRVQKFNDFADRIFARPLARGYRAVMPDFGEKAVHNFFVNVGTPVVAFNQLLQGKGKLAGRDTARFIVNSTVGLGGLLDVAKDMNLEAHQEDFGQTFGKWGAGPGPYLVIPFLGPSNFRDGIGNVAGMLTNPLRFIDNTALRYGLLGGQLLDTRAQLLGTEGLVTGDAYLFFRDGYLQRREYLIADGELEDSFLDDDF